MNTAGSNPRPSTSQSRRTSSALPEPNSGPAPWAGSQLLHGKSHAPEEPQLGMLDNLDGRSPVSAIGRQILDELGTLGKCEVQFMVKDWDAGSFLSEQFFKEDGLPELSKVITLAGSLTDAWAVSCREYVDRTWPAIGRHLLAALQEALHTGATPSILSK